VVRASLIAACPNCFTPSCIGGTFLSVFSINLESQSTSVSRTRLLSTRLLQAHIRRLQPSTPSISQPLPVNCCTTPDVDQRLVTVDSQWLWHVRGTSCRRLGDRVFPVASARARNILPSFVRNAPSLTTFRREMKTTFTVVVWRWLGDRDCTAQCNCCLPASDCWLSVIVLFIFCFVYFCMVPLQCDRLWHDR